jgi:predicted  nucleic acid-binding Zn-ribbon protein
MACMEHVCQFCGKIVFDNERVRLVKCECGCNKWINIFDEERDWK